MADLKNMVGGFNLLSKWNKLAPREKSLFLASVAILSFLFLDLIVVRPLWNHYISLADQTVFKEKKLLQNMLNISRKDLIEKEYEKYKDYIHEPASNEEETAAMLREIEKLARGNEVVVVDMKPKEVLSEKFHKEYKVDLDVETEMSPLLRFIHQIESSSQLMRVEQAKLQLKSQESPVVKAKMTVTKIVLM